MIQKTVNGLDLGLYRPSALMAFTFSLTVAENMYEEIVLYVLQI
jgi:hypothetical protein